MICRYYGCACISEANTYQYRKAVQRCIRISVKGPNILKVIEGMKVVVVVT